MRFNFIYLIVLSFLISSCANTDLKRSSSNKLFDMSGFESNKRMPLYNKKYINIAKRNVREIPNDEIETDGSEVDNPELDNILMYKEMISSSSMSDKPILSKKLKMIDDSKDHYDGDLVKSRKKIESLDSGKSKEELEKEIIEIKKLLHETKEEIQRLQSNNKRDQSSKDLSQVLDEELKTVSHEKKDTSKKNPIRKQKNTHKKQEKKKEIIKKELPLAKPGAISRPVSQ